MHNLEGISAAFQKPETYLLFGSDSKQNADLLSCTVRSWEQSQLNTQESSNTMEVNASVCMNEWMNEQITKKKKTKKQQQKNKSKGSTNWTEAGKVLASMLLYKRHR